jgi:hypothetical protein
VLDRNQLKANDNAVRMTEALWHGGMFRDEAALHNKEDAGVKECNWQGNLNLSERLRYLIWLLHRQTSSSGPKA